MSIQPCNYCNKNIDTDKADHFTNEDMTLCIEEEMANKESIWEEVTKEEYMEAQSDELKVISSFTDMDGTSRFGVGHPCADTMWGIGGVPMLKCTMEMESRHDKKWNYTYYKHK